MKHLKKFAAVSQLNNWIYNNLSSYEEPNIYTIGNNKDNLEVQYNKDYTIIVLDTSIQNSVTANPAGSLWTTYNGDIYEEILLDDVKIDNPMTPLTYNDVSKGKHILKIKFKNKKIGNTSPVFYNSFVKHVKIAKNITEIGLNVFLSCSGLKSISIPDSVTKIGNYAFSGCTLLESINIPKLVTYIKSYTFANCKSLTSINIPENIVISDFAFTNTGLKFINFASNVDISNNAFQGCSSLESITFNGSANIANAAFVGCSSLESITFNGSANITNAAFQGCSSLESITFNDPVTISNSAFVMCSSLTSIRIPENSVLSNKAFERCSSLTSIYIPESVTKINNYPLFYGCMSLGYVENGIRYVYINSNIGTEIIEFDDTTLTSYSIKEGITDISFKIPVLPNAISFNIPDSVCNISNSVLDNIAKILTSEQLNTVLSINENCISKNVKKVIFGYVENGIKYYDDPSTGTEIVDFVDTTLTSYSIKSGVTKINIIIPNLPNAEEIIIPSSVTSYIDHSLNNVVNILSKQQIDDLFNTKAIDKDLILNNNLLSKSYLSQQYFSIYNSDSEGHYIKFKPTGTPSDAKYFEYSNDNGNTWYYISSTNINSLRILSHETVIIKSNIIPNTTYNNITSSSGLPCRSYYISSPNWPVYSGIGLISLDHESLIPYGNIMSLLKGDNFVNTTLTSKYSFAGLFECSAIENASNIILPSNTTEDCYYNMFFGCTKLNKTPELPATILAEGCYNSMFSSCTALTVAPELPATTLASNCYRYMFNGCTNLTTAPELPATTLAAYCYYSMFNKCSSLTTAPELPATTLTDMCYQSMFYGCTALTVAPELPATTLTGQCYYMMFYCCTALTVAPELPATTLTDRCYQSMFYGCTSLTTAPSVLPATTLAMSCYYMMFYGCTALTVAPSVLPATTLADYCYQEMFSGCTSLTTTPELPATTLANYCYYMMFNNCSSLTTAPELPATTLATYCYYKMFSGCTSLNYVKMLATNISSSSCTSNWLQNVASIGTFVKHIDATWSNSNVVPSGWTVEYYEERPTPRELPKGYTEVKYIASTNTGGQYIDLNIKLYETLNTNYDIAIKFNIIGQGLNNSTNAPIFACQDPTGSPWPGTFIRRTASSNNVVGRYIGGTAKDNTIGQVNTIIELPVQTPPNKNVTNLSNSGKTHSYGTSLFCVFGDTNNTARDFTEAKLYYFKLFVEGTLVRDLVPCINSSNVAGLYDVVNDVFYTSPNGAAFIYEAWAS